jgi:RNA polymerase sigma-70 factor (ECF subfamily)
LPVSEARSGDPAAWDTLFRRYQLPLYAYIFELVRDRETSFDIVQETFVNAVRHIAGLRDDDKFGSWIFGIAHQKCIQHWRRRNRESMLREELGDVPEEHEPGPVELLFREEQEAEFMNLIERLPLEQRSAIVLHFIEDFSIEEIAGITGAQPGTVKSRLHYAKRALRRLMENRQSPRTKSEA